MTISISPKSGRLVIRQMADKHSSLAGILHLPDTFTPEEGVAYLATMFDGDLQIHDTPLDKGIDESVAGFGVQALLLSKIWRATSVPDSTVVRFMGAFPEENSWTVIGASIQPLMQSADYDKAGHAWFDVTQGKMNSISLGVKAEGQQMAQLLNNIPVWPDASGVLHTLPTIETSYREAYRDHSLLLAQYGAGEIDRDTLLERFAADPKVSKIRTGSIDKDYCAYLAKLRDAGQIQVVAPIAVHDMPARKAAVGKAYIASLEALESGPMSPKQSLRM